MKWATPQEFLNSTLNKKYDMDSYPKTQPYQCWDYGDYFWVNQVGRSLVTKAGGNGSARDCWNISKFINAGNDFDLIYDKRLLKTGDWIITDGGKNGHIGIVAGIVTTGEIVLLQSENNGSIYVNRKNFTLSTFLGGFRLKEWNKTESFLPPKGYWGYGDRDARVGQLASFMYKTFPAYTNKKALGNFYGNYLMASIKEFQRRTGLVADGNTGPITYKMLQKYGFNG